MKKRTLALLMAAMMSLSLAACGGDTTSQTTDAPASASHNAALAGTQKSGRLPAPRPGHRRHFAMTPSKNTSWTFF